MPVTTGITGATDIEVTHGVKPGDRIVTGTYRVLRDLKENALVKQDYVAGCTSEPRLRHPHNQAAGTTIREPAFSRRSYRISRATGVLMAPETTTEAELRTAYQLPTPAT